MTSQIHNQAMARMARDAWVMSVNRQRAAEAEMQSAWTMESMARAGAAKKQQEAAWKVMDRAERAAEEAE